MKQINFKSKDDINKIQEIFTQYNETFPIHGDSVGYFSDNDKSVLLCNTNPIGGPIDLIAKEFYIISQIEDTPVMYSKMNRIIYKQKCDIVSITTNNENYDFFLNNQCRILNHKPEIRKTTRFEKVINKEKLQKIKIKMKMYELKRELNKRLAK